MKHLHLEIRVHTIDGSTRLWLQRDPELVRRTLAEVHPALIFAHDEITLSDGDMETTLLPPLITRIDLVTDHWSVWDFPFVLGALMEVTEGEFMQGLSGLKNWRHPATQSELPVFLDVEMLNGQRLFLQMEVVGGLAAARLEKVHSLLKEHSLIFGLRTGGIGILNLSNMVHFEVHPEPPQPASKGMPRYKLNQQKQVGANGEPHHETGNGQSHSTLPLAGSQFTSRLDESETYGNAHHLWKEDNHD